MQQKMQISLSLLFPFKTSFAKTPSLEKVLHEIELPLVPVLSDMEQAGTLVNEEALKFNPII